VGSLVWPTSHCRSSDCSGSLAKGEGLFIKKKKEKQLKLVVGTGSGGGVGRQDCCEVCEVGFGLEQAMYALGIRKLQLALGLRPEGLTGLKLVQSFW